jgi:hypothetical protein
MGENGKDRSRPPMGIGSDSSHLLEYSQVFGYPKKLLHDWQAGGCGTDLHHGKSRTQEGPADF